MYNANGTNGIVKFQEMSPMKVKTSDGVKALESIKVPTLDEAGKEAAKGFVGLGSMDGSYNLFNVPQKVQDSGLAFLVGELEKRDTTLYEPLTTFYWQRDMPLRSGGGAVDFISFLNINWGTTEANLGYIDGNTDALDTVSVDIDKTIGKVRVWAKNLKIGFTDMQRANQVGRSLEEMLSNGIVKQYNKELDRVTMEGWSELNIPGLYNNTNVQTATVPNGAGGSPLWSNKTPDEILQDVNELLVSVWTTSEFDIDGMPNRLLLPPAVYGDIATRKVSDAGNISILEYLLKNNIAINQGVTLEIYPNRYGIGAGAGATDRMVAYRYDDGKIRFHLPIPLTRAFTSLDAGKFAYMTPYYAYISHDEFVYEETVGYRDGI